jgi:hypothetical protein
MRLNHHSCVGMAIIGLLAVSAVASDGIPSEGEQVTVSLRRLSTSEVMSILDKFPEMVPSYLASVKDREHLASLFPLSEVTAAPLRSAFPAARFYQGQSFAKPPYPYLMAIVGNRREIMPGAFNRLLLDNSVTITDRNAVELARNFVMLSIGSEPNRGNVGSEGKEDTLPFFPQITFLDERATSQVIDGVTYKAELRVKIAGAVEEWYFDIWSGLFRFVARKGPQGPIKEYLPALVESLPGRR